MSTSLRLLSFAIALIGALSFTADTSFAQTDKMHPPFDHLNPSKKVLAIEGHDPVAYLKEFGGKATKDSKSITTAHRGVTYRFASEKNKKAIIANPSKFELQYGGWYAWAISQGKGKKVDPNIKSFTVENGKLFSFTLEP
ncbi:MAG: YHS domain-containing protein [Planctomycetota bacterium]|jgi:YHS domain-containing protein